MSEFHVNVVRVGKIGKHPNADALSITHIHGGYPVIFRTGDYKEGDLAVYLSIDSIVPSDDPRWSFLGGHFRIKAKRLRGIFSMGLLTPSEPDWIEGQNVQQELRIEKYEIPESLTMGGENEKDPGFLPVYDVEGLRKYERLFVEGESVWISEKIHGANARFVHDGDRLWVGSRTCIKRESDINLWWVVAQKYELSKKLSNFPNVAIYGEVYGQVQDLKYGVPQNETARLVLFDAMDIKSRRWFDVYEFKEFIDKLELPIVPTFHFGPWKSELKSLAEGKSIMPGADHVREGIVIKPVKERYDQEIGRVFLKLHGEGFLLRKER